MKQINSTGIIIATTAVLSLTMIGAAFRPLSLRKERSQETSSHYKEKVINRRGDIYLSGGTLLVTTEVSKDEDGAETSWRQITPEFDTALGNIIGTFTGGLDEQLSRQLREDNPQTDPFGRGRSIQLTLSENTLAVYNSLTVEQQVTAGAVALAPTGAVLCICSTPSYAQEDFRTSERYRTSLTGSDALQNHALEAIEIPEEVLKPYLDAVIGKNEHSSAIVNRFFRDDLCIGDMSCDFGTLEASFDASRRVAKCSIVQLAAILPASTNDGTIYKPYLVKQTLDTVTHQPLEDETSPCAISTLQHPDEIVLPEKGVFDTEDGWLCYAVEDHSTIVVHLIDTYYDGLDTHEDAANFFDRMLNELEGFDMT